MGQSRAVPWGPLWWAAWTVLSLGLGQCPHYHSTATASQGVNHRAFTHPAVDRNQLRKCKLCLFDMGAGALVPAGLLLLAAEERASPPAVFFFVFCGSACYSVPTARPPAALLHRLTGCGSESYPSADGTTLNATKVDRRMAGSGKHNGQ